MQTIQIKQFALEEALLVNRLFREIDGHCRAARDQAAAARDKAIELGDTLIRVKATLPHGGFLLWIKDHCSFTRKTAALYMKLAKVTRELHLPDDLSLRATMVALGILPAVLHAPGHARQASADPYAPLNVFNRYLAALPAGQPELWRADPAERAAMRQQYLPLRRWLEELFAG